MNLKKLLFISIVFFAFVLRIFNLGQTPPSLNWDEVSHGYNAYSILKTGKDEWGQALPLIFRAYGDYKLPIYIYLTAFSEAILGVNEFSVRLISSLSGVAAVVFTYLLIKKLFNSERIALSSAFLLTIEPWHLFISRIAVEANLSLAFIIAGAYFLIKGLKDMTYASVFGVGLLGLSVWTYNSARVFVPLLLVSGVIIYRSEIKEIFINKKDLFVASVFVFLFLFIPMFYQLASNTGQARYGWVQILDEGATQRIINTRQSIELPGILPRLISNKLTYFGSTFAKNYFSHFSPDYLFFKGGSHYQFSIPNIGLLYAVNLPFFIIGFARCLIEAKWNRNIMFVVAWIIAAPIASSLTREAPHALRSIVMLPIPMLLTSLGLITVFDFLKSRNKNFSLVILILCVVTGVLLLKNYLHIYVKEYSVEYSSSWQYGHKEVVDYVKTNYDKYDKVIFSKKYGEPHEFILFYSSWDPDKYRNDANLNRFYQSDWYWVDSFDKFYFVNDWEVPEDGQIFIQESKREVDCMDSRCLLVTSPGNYPKDWNKLYVVNFLSGEPAFEIYDNIIR